MGTNAKLTWPLADRDTKWNSSEAHKRIVDHFTDKDGKMDWKGYASVHFWFDSSAPDPDKDGVPDRMGDYKLPFCDVIDGDIQAVPRGVFGDAAVMQGSRGGADIPKDDEGDVKKAIEHYYTKMAKEFKDDSIVVPWNKRSLILPVGDIRAAEPKLSEDGTEKTVKISGHAIVFNQRADISGLFDEVVLPGAFNGCDLTDVPLFVNHNARDIPLARSRRNNGNSTMTLTPDDKGLAFEAELDIENNDKARSLYSAVNRQDINQMSFQFLTAKEKWDFSGKTPLRSIEQFEKIFEISAVTFPAYSGTDIETSSRDAHALESARALLESNQSSALESEKREMEALELEKLKLQLR